MARVNAQGFGALGLDVHHAVSPQWSAFLGLYNLFNTHAAAAQFWYVDRLQSEIATYPTVVRTYTSTCSSRSWRA